MQFPLSPTPQQRRIRRIPTITLQTMKHIRGNCMRNWVWAQQCGKRGLNTTPVAVGPGFETTRRSATRPTGEEGAGGAGGPGCGARGWWRGLAGLRGDAPSRRLAARTASGRAAAHGRTKQPGPTSQALRRPEHPWGHKPPGPAGQAKTSGTGRRHDPRLGRQGAQSCNPQGVRNVGGATRPGHSQGGPDEGNDVGGGPAQAS